MLHHNIGVKVFDTLVQKVVFLQFSIEKSYSVIEFFTQKCLTWINILEFTYEHIVIIENKQTNEQTIKQYSLVCTFLILIAYS